MGPSSPPSSVVDVVVSVVVVVGFGGLGFFVGLVVVVVVGTVVGLGLVTSADPHLAVITAFLMPASLASSPLAMTNLGIVLGFLLSGVLYAVLTLRTRTAAAQEAVVG